MSEKMEKNEFLEAALGYASSGLRVFPLHSIDEDGVCDCPRGLGCQSPGKHPRISEWEKRATTDVEAIKTWWRRWPEANVAIACGRESGIFVVDVDVGKEKDGEVVDDGRLWFTARKADLPDDVPRQDTPSGGFHLVFKAPPEGSVRNRGHMHRGVDVRGDGGYIVAAPSVGADGVRYEWYDEANPADAPEAPDWLLNAVRSNVVRPSNGPGRWKRNIPLDAREWQRLASAMNCISPEEYEDWIKVGMAIHSDHSGDEGFDLWCQWAKQSAKFDLAEHEYKWKSFDSYGDVTKGTLYWMAQARGWIEPELDPVVEVAKSEEEVAQDWLNAESDEFPEPLCEPPGLMGAISRWITETARTPLPVGSLAGAIAAMSGICLRRWTWRGTTPNLYVVLVAPSGSGKAHPAKCVKNIFREKLQLQHAGGTVYRNNPLQDVEGAGNISSEAAIMLDLSKAPEPKKVYLIDEIGNWLGGLSGQGVQRGHMQSELYDFLLKLWSSADEVLKGKVTAARDPIDLHYPAVTVYGGTTPGVWGRLGAQAYNDGMLSRLLVLQTSSHGEPVEQGDDHSLRPPDSIVEAVTAISESFEQEKGAADVDAVAAGLPPFHALRSQGGKDGKVSRMLSDLSAEQNKLVKLDRYADSSPWVRLRETSMRLAMLSCIGRDSREVSPEDLEWASAVVRHSLQAAVKRGQEDQSDPFAVDCKLVLDYIRLNMPHGVSAREISRRRRLTKRRRVEILEALSDSGQIVCTIKETPGGGRDSEVYFAVG